MSDNGRRICRIWLVLRVRAHPVVYLRDVRHPIFYPELFFFFPRDARLRPQGDLLALTPCFFFSED
jgi:hypothetical protein